MPDLSPFHGWIVFAHILGVFLFLIAHGVSVAAVLRLHSERDPAALRTLLDLSRRSMTAMGVGFLVWFFGGILAGFSGNYWTTGRYWIWASLAVAVAVMGIMTPMGRIYLNRVRAAVGIDPRTGVIDSAATVDPVALEAAIGSGRPVLLASIGVVSVAVLAWLMMFKPF
ncbi:MAG TPA: hypothetical protein VJK49_06090 [Candidatus Limnocylindrales bacterium]|nr:hypothetical protein [Candidatus Limnocylindrales bacterium]